MGVCAVLDFTDLPDAPSTFRRPLTKLRTDLAADLGFHQPLREQPHAFPQEVRVG